MIRLSETSNETWCWKSVTYEENDQEGKKSFLNIWSVRKKAVPLQPFSRLLQVSRKIERKGRKNVMLKISHLRRKCKENWKKLLKNLVSPKKSSTFAADFALNEKWCAKSQWSLRDWSNNVVQASRKLLNWETENV